MNAILSRNRWRRAIASGLLTTACCGLLAATASLQSTGPIVFADATAAVGIAFVHSHGGFGRKYLPETMGSGVVFFDMDADGWQDVFLVNSKSLDPAAAGKSPSLPALYRNVKGTFTNVTRGSGLDVELYGIGGASADYDNDGRADLYVTAVGGNRLFRNLGDGRFSDVTKQAGVPDGGFSTSALWFDYDKDGRLDLYVANYVQWTAATDLHCSLDGKNKSYCTPEAYKGQSGSLYRNLGGGRFENVTRKAGVFDPSSKGLGVAMLDYDEDGWMDLFVANDTEPNRLYRNRGNGTFEDVAVAAGVAFSQQGVARAGMGVDVADYDGSGRPSVIVGNFSQEMMALFRNEGKGLFFDEAPRGTIGRATLLTLTFGCFFFDFDLDGRPDIFSANGHVSDDIEKVQPRVTYAQPPHLLRNIDGKQFEDMRGKVGPAIARPVVGRGAAYADYDNDGDLDVLMTVNNGPPRLLRNDGGNRSNLIRIRTVGTSSNRDGIGARVDVTAAGGRRAWQIVKTGSSYASQSELPLTFGLGAASNVESIRVTWPNGRVDAVAGQPANQVLTIEEGKGVVRATPIAIKR